MFLFRKKEDKRSDDELLNALRSNADAACFEVLFKRYTHLVFLTANKYLQNEEDSKDAVLEIFQKVSLELRKGEITDFKNWLYTVTKNHCLMKLRKKVPPAVSLENGEILLSHFVENSFPVHHYDEKEKLIEQLEGSLEQLNPEQRLCLKLFYMEGKSYREISDATEFDLKKIKSHIQNGKRNLRIILTTKKQRR